MLLRISENLIVDINEIRYLFKNELCLKGGQCFKVDEITVRNLNKIAEKQCVQFFGEPSEYD